MTWKALVPSLYVYHCATPMVAEHIARHTLSLPIFPGIREEQLALVVNAVSEVFDGG